MQGQRSDLMRSGFFTLYTALDEWIVRRGLKPILVANKLNRCTTFNSLGVTFDQCMAFDEHSDYKIQKAYAALTGFGIRRHMSAIA